MLKPFLAVLYRYPGFPVVLHYSGLLLEWLEERHPEFLMLLTEMVKRKQVEILGGGYYDPILSMLPSNDKLGQLEKMTTYLRVKFETRPRGCWLSETVWEPLLSSVLRSSGMDYTFLEDSQFRLSGLEDGEQNHAFIAEDQGKIITLFPLNTQLSALLPKGDPQEAVGILKAAADSEGRKVAVVMMDGERLREPPGQKGLESFLRVVAENAEWLTPVTPTQYMREVSPAGKVYIPCTSSADMAGWALSPKRRQYVEANKQADAAPFLHGGYFRQFLSRYAEGELMYAKMMNTHVLVSQIRGDKYKKKAAQNELWKGQCHNAYWFGSGGGIYANNLRKAVYRSLIEAEKITRATEIFAPSILSVDFDLDTNVEYLYQGSELNCYIHLRGGVLFELDFLPASWNYLDTMARRDESSPPKRRDATVVDRTARRAFMDHFFNEDCTLESFDSADFTEAGDFMQELYEVMDLNRSLPEVLLRRVGAVTVGESRQQIEIQKRFIFRPRSVDVYYRVTNLSPIDLSLRFGVEINFSLASRSPESGRIFRLEQERKTDIGLERAEIEGVNSLLIRDVPNEVSITLSSAEEFLCWSMPVETVTPHPEEGQERIFQSYCLVPQWRMDLSQGGSWENHLSVGFEKSQGG